MAESVQQAVAVVAKRDQSQATGKIAIFLPGHEDEPSFDFNALVSGLSGIGSGFAGITDTLSAQAETIDGQNTTIAGLTDTINTMQETIDQLATRVSDLEAG